MQLVFNEASLLDVSDNKETGIEIFENFLKTYSKAVSKEIGFSHSIITAFDLNNIEIAKGYFTAEWRNSKSIDRDLQTRYKRICDLQKIQSCPDDDSELTCNGITSIGLQIAYLNELIAISINNSDCWNNYNLESIYCTLKTDEIFKVEIRNIYSTQSIYDNLSDISKIKQTYENSCFTPQELYDTLEEKFPSLIFHKVAKDQIKNQLEKQHIPIVVKKLKQLEDYFCNWNGGLFNQNAFPNKSVSPQSAETLERFKAEHTFNFDGEEILVSYHIRYTGNIPGRIYFYPDKELKKARVCSLTTKLPTVTEPKAKI